VAVEVDKQDKQDKTVQKDEQGEQKEQNEQKEPDELEQMKTIKDVPIDVENLGDDQDVSFIEPEGATMELTAAGKEEDIGKLSADDVTLSVDLTDLDAGEHKVPISINGPDGNDYTSEFDEVTIEITG
jgi:YbbR domain-containing protein